MIVNKIAVKRKEHVFFPKATHAKFIENVPSKYWVYISVPMPGFQCFLLQTISLHCSTLLLCCEILTPVRCISCSSLWLGCSTDSGKSTCFLFLFLAMVSFTAPFGLFISRATQFCCIWWLLLLCEFYLCGQENIFTVTGPGWVIILCNLVHSFVSRFLDVVSSLNSFPPVLECAIHLEVNQWLT